MRYLAYSCLFISLLLVVTPQLHAQSGPLSIEEMSITTRIFRGGPVDAVQRISVSAIHELYCYTKVVAPGDGKHEIVHAWYRNGELMARCHLPVSGISWRTYSKKRITPEMAGAWRVDVLDSAGNLLGSRKFILN
ncbi:MAG: DUF2914 domain-containing protein [Geobacteraceae bacterium]